MKSYRAIQDRIRKEIYTYIDEKEVKVLFDTQVVLCSLKMERDGLYMFINPFIYERLPRDSSKEMILEEYEEFTRGF